MSNNLTVLVIDKNSECNGAISKMLSQDMHIHRVLQAANAEAAFKIIENEPKLDWILSEIELSDYDYFDFVTEARKHASAAESTLIVTAENVHREALVAAAVAGAVDFVTKPIKMSILLLKLRNLMSRQYQRASERLAVAEELNTEIIFKDDLRYKGRLLDISTGGCQIIAEPFAGGGSVLDQVTLSIHTSNEYVSVKCVLVRLERCYMEEGKIRAAFQFVDEQPEVLKQIEAFIEYLNRDDA